MDAQANTTNKVDNEEAAMQALIKSKISQIENAEGLVTKAQLKEMTTLVTSLLSDTEMPIEEKAKQINNKYAQALQEATTANAEKEKVYVQLSKVNKLKDKLEILCRELQKQNKTIIDESKKIAEDEQTKRNDLSKKFHETIQQITVKMDEQAEERLKLVKENEMLREKMLNFAEQYEIREKHFETQAKAHDLELQLVGAKLKQQAEIAIQESMRAKAYNEQITTLTAREKELSTQLAYYAEKFEQFQDTLTKSNDIFTTFKQEMEKMSKTIKKGEKENADLRKKCEQTDVALISLAEEKNTLKKQIEQNAVQKKKLEELCRALQTERTQLRQEIQNHADKNGTQTTTSEDVQEVKQ